MSTIVEKLYKSFIKGPNEIDEVPTKPPKLSSNMAERFLLTNKVSVITGGLGGIAKCIATGFAQSGSHVVLLDYIDDKGIFANQLMQQYSIKAKNYQMDVTKPEVVERVINQVIEDFDHIDVFVANAGVPWYKGPVIDDSCTVDDWHRMMDINLHGVFYCAKYVGKHFYQRNKGSLVMTASMSSHIVNVPQYKAAYNVSKAGVLHFSKSLAVEWAAFARVNTVSPGYTDTALSGPVPTDDRAKWWAMTPMGREGQPEEIVGAYIYLASDASSYTTGADIRVDGGYTLI